MQAQHEPSYVSYPLNTLLHWPVIRRQQITAPAVQVVIRFIRSVLLLYSALDPQNRRKMLLLLPPAVIDCTLPRAPSLHAPHRALPTSPPLCYLTALYPAFFLSIAVTCTAIYFRTTVLKGEVGAGKGCQLTRCRCVGALVSWFESLRLFILSIFMPLLSQI